MFEKLPEDDPLMLSLMPHSRLRRRFRNYPVDFHAA